MKKLSQGFLICVEGIDGSGKSSFSQALCQALTHAGYQTLVTREPGGTPLGERVRAILFDTQTPPTPKTEFLLFAASRAQHCDEKIKPALAQGYIVISDRMADSSLVYQGYVRGLSLDLIKKVNTWSLDGLQPHIVFYLDIAAHTALERIRARNTPGASFEDNLAHLERALTGFKNALHNRPEVITLDANQTPETVFAQGLKKLQAHLATLTLP